MYEERWAELNARLRDIEETDGLAAAFAQLDEEQRDAGFIRFDAATVQRYSFQHPKDRDAFFRAQFSPIRAMRLGPREVDPVAGARPVNDGCYLCRDNVRWQQAGRELGYELLVGAGPYIAWMNPFPLMPHNVVVASAGHLPQGPPNGRPGLDLSRLVEDLVDLAARLPGYIGFHNGTGAGASNPAHLHFHFFERPRGYGLFPLEIAARRSAAAGSGSRPLDGYPLTAFHWLGAPRDVARRAAAAYLQWVAADPEQAAHASANFIAVRDGEGRGMHVYFVPRDRRRSSSADLTGTIGGIEVLGELVFSRPDDQERLECGEIDYAAIARILAAASVPWPT